MHSFELQSLGIICIYISMSSGRVNGNLIRRYIAEKKATYESLAAEIGVSTSLVRQMEHGYYPRRNSNEILSALAQLLGCSVGALVTPPVAKKAS